MIDYGDFATRLISRKDRWSLLAEYVREWNLPIEGKSRYSDKDVEEAEARLGFKLPISLWEWYQLPFQPYQLTKNYVTWQLVGWTLLTFTRALSTAKILIMPVIDNHLMVWVSVDEIKRDLSAYLQRLKAGETVVIVQAGKPVAEIKPVVSGTTASRPFGLCAGEFTVPDDFDEPLPQSIIEEFEGR